MNNMWIKFIEKPSSHCFSAGSDALVNSVFDSTFTPQKFHYLSPAIQIFSVKKIKKKGWLVHFTDGEQNHSFFSAVQPSFPPLLLPFKILKIVHTSRIFYEVTWKPNIEQQGFCSRPLPTLVPLTYKNSTINMKEI